MRAALQNFHLHFYSDFLCQTFLKSLKMFSVTLKTQQALTSYPQESQGHIMPESSTSGVLFKQQAQQNLEHCPVCVTVLIKAFRAL